MSDAPRIALIHALAHSIEPIVAALARDWPDARPMNLLDDSLSADLARAGRIDAAMTARFVALADYAFATGADAILFTCSAFGECIDAARRRHAGRVVLKPNEAMVDDALAMRAPIALVATFAPTLASMPAEFGAGADVRPVLADGALAALERGDVDAHDRLVADAAARAVAAGADVVALAQFSMARAAPAAARAVVVPVLTTPASAVRRLRDRLSSR